MATTAPVPNSSVLDQKLKDNPPAKWGVAIFGVVLVSGVVYIISKLAHDLSSGASGFGVSVCVAGDGAADRAGV